MSTTATERARSGLPGTVVDQIGSTEGPAQATARHRQVSWPVLGALVALMVLSTVAHLWALHRTLPVPDVDESTFVRPAVHIAATGSLNPRWFGHPGSTVIYPVAGLFHVWDALAHHGPILGPDSTLPARFDRYPTSFYVIARLWTIALSVGALPLLFLVGRRAFNTRVALIATAIWAALPLPVSFGRYVRTDSAGLFFGLLALWLCLRLLDEPRTRWCVLAGLGVGLAISSRYFMLALVPGLVAAAVLPHRRVIGRAVRSAGIALGSAVAGFALTTPYFFLDWDSVVRSLKDENAPHAGADGLSPLGNLRWYLGTAIPASMTWALVALAVAGLALVVWRPRTRQVLLVAFGAIFLAGISASRLHWERWVIQLMPVLALLAAFALVAITHRLAAPAVRVLRAPVLAPLALVALTAALAIHPLGNLLQANRDDNRSSTRSDARHWVLTHIPRKSLFGDDGSNAAITDPRWHIDNRIDPETHTLADYQRAGYEYLVVNAAHSSTYRFDPARYPRKATFYTALACKTRLVAAFTTGTGKRGWPIHIYQLQEPPRKLLNILCTQQADG